jgi:hypothetical protein
MGNQRLYLALCGAALGMMLIGSARADRSRSRLPGGTSAVPPGRRDLQPGLRIGWATADITPAKPVSIAGFLSKRISTGVRDRLTATALALESRRCDGTAEEAILVSCDLLWIRRSTQEAVRKLAKGRLSDFDPDKLLLNATHTHQGPLQQSGVFDVYDVTAQEQARGIMTGDQYGAFLAERLADAAVKAWQGRKPGGMSWGLDQAGVGFNRRFVYFDGSAKMLRPVNNPEFDCVEGVEDHGLGLLFFWDLERRLTGVVINVACPAQADQGGKTGNLISADFWTDVREEVAARHKGVFVLPQCGAAGDIYTEARFRQRAEAAMAKRKGITWRREIAMRIVDGLDRALPYAQSDVNETPTFQHTVVRANLPTKGTPPSPFYTCDPVQPAEFHAIRLGDAAIVTSPFELFTDYGLRIQARSKAVCTLVVQLCCQHSGYLPSARAVRGGGYSADKALVGPEGGRVFVDECVSRINALWSQ